MKWLEVLLIVLIGLLIGWIVTPDNWYLMVILVILILAFGRNSAEIGANETKRDEFIEELRRKGKK